LAKNRGEITRPPAAAGWLRLAGWMERQHLATSVFFLGVTGLFAVGLTRLEPSTRLKDFFGTNSRIFHDYQWFEQHVSMLNPLEVLVRFPRDCGLSFTQRLAVITRLQAEIQQLDGQPATYSAANLCPRPPTGHGVSQVAERVILERRLLRRRDDLLRARRLLEDAGDEIWRVTVRVSATQELDYGLFAARLRRVVEQVLQDQPTTGTAGVSATYTGSVLLSWKVRNEQWEVLLKSFFMALVLIGATMMAVCTSVPAGLLSMLPNVFPLVVSFGLMGWVGRSLDTGSIMTASIALGIAVDDTLHYLTWYRRGQREGRSRPDSVRYAYQRCGAAMIQASMICGCALLVFVLSPFLPAACFGGLMFTMLVAALAGDLFLLPALLLGPAGIAFSPHGTKKS
jgi:hypothetical protein